MSRDNETIVINAERIFVPSRGFVDGCSLLIRQGIIETISETIPPSEDIRILDYSPYTISPPFCDFHVHFSMNNSDDLKNAELLLKSHGIFKVYEGGDSKNVGTTIKENSKRLIDVKTCGFALYKKGGYGKALGAGARNAAEARRLIDSLVELDVNYIKVINSGIFNPETGTLTQGGFTKAEIEDIITYAKVKGLDVFCHANGDQAISDAVLAGASAIIHGFFISDESLSLMAEKNTAFIPTVYALSRLLTREKNPRVTHAIKTLVFKHLDAVQKASEKGVRILVGSDSGPSFLPFGKSYHGELELFKKAGLSTEQILTSATSRPISEGDRAIVIVLDGLTIKNVLTL